jgi:hypothetical protein
MYPAHQQRVKISGRTCAYPPRLVLRFHHPALSASVKYENSKLTSPSLLGSVRPGGSLTFDTSSGLRPPQTWPRKFPGSCLSTCIIVKLSTSCARGLFARLCESGGATELPPYRRSRINPFLDRTVSERTLKVVVSPNGPASQVQIQGFENARALFSMTPPGNF